MQETTNLGLELYEPTDNANLEDGYNVSMRKLDQRDGEVSTLISALNTTVASFDGRITSAQADATSALNIGTEAAATATTAATNAAQAILQLGGAHIEHIHYTDEGTLWTAGTWASRSCAVNALVIYDEEDDHGIMIGEFFAQSNATTPTTSWQPNYVATFRDWKADTAEGHDAYGYIEIINNDWHDSGSHTRIDNQGRLYWEVYTGVSDALPAGEAVTGIFVTAVTKR